MPLKLLDLFSGIGGFSYAAEHLLGGFTTTQFVECSPYCQTVLKKHWPTVPIHDDICTYTAEPGEFDVICGGFPCQDISAAGNQTGLQGSRSGLFYEVMRLVRTARPRFVLLENVGNLLSHANGQTFQEVIYQISKAGYDAEWACIPASDVGACHKRNRMWIVAHTNGDRLEGQKRCGPYDQSWSQEGLRRLNPHWRGYLSEPVLHRGDDGLSGKLDRLKALGNAVVPQVAAIPLRRIQELARTP